MQLAVESPSVSYREGLAGVARLAKAIKANGDVPLRLLWCVGRWRCKGGARSITLGTVELELGNHAEPAGARHAPDVRANVHTHPSMPGGARPDPE
jgi:hypothetical protein